MPPNEFAELAVSGLGLPSFMPWAQSPQFPPFTATRRSGEYSEM
jgi:hypothetical protein